MHVATFSSVRLWSRLCIIEEAEALKFVWNQSVAYSHFLDALRMDVAKVCQQTQLRSSIFLGKSDRQEGNTGIRSNAKRGALANESFRQQVSTPKWLMLVLVAFSAVLVSSVFLLV